MSLAHGLVTTYAWASFMGGGGVLKLPLMMSGGGGGGYMPYFLSTSPLLLLSFSEKGHDKDTTAKNL